MKSKSITDNDLFVQNKNRVMSANPKFKQDLTLHNSEKKRHTVKQSLDVSPSKMQKKLKFINVKN